MVHRSGRDPRLTGATGISPLFRAVDRSAIIPTTFAVAFVYAQQHACEAQVISRAGSFRGEIVIVGVSLVPQTMPYRFSVCNGRRQHAQSFDFSDHRATALPWLKETALVKSRDRDYRQASNFAPGTGKHNVKPGPAQLIRQSEGVKMPAQSRASPLMSISTPGR